METSGSEEFSAVREVREASGTSEAAGGFELALNSTQQRILELLGAGASQSQVAMAVGVEDSYVSQLMANEDFRSGVQALRAEAAAKHAATDAKIDNIEDIAWKRIESLVPMETNLMKLLKVATAANAAKRKSGGNAVTAPATAQIVNIQLPQSAVVEFKMTPDRQVVEISGRSMNTMSSAKVHAALREKRAKELVEDVTPQVNGKTADLLSQF
jgi:transcriptional regulator with XRE-family HTH domain